MSRMPNVYLRRRLEAVGGLLALCFLLLVIRAIDLQWLKSDQLQAVVDKQRHRHLSVAAPRGPILDIKERILAESIEVPSIFAIARDVPPERLPQLAKALGISTQQLKRQLEGRSGFVWLARQIKPVLADRVMALNIPGILRETEWRRYHPLGPETGHLLGFVGIDGQGLEGLEHRLQPLLAGKPGRQLIRRDARGNALPGGVWLHRPTSGKPVKLYLDATIQSLAYAALVEGIRQHGAKGGSVVIMRPRDGAVLAMVNWPGYNPNDFSQFKPNEWRNRAITDVFEPGSVLKPFTVAAALISGRWHRDSRIFGENGHFVVADYAIHDAHPEQWLNMTDLLARSSNIGAAKLALDIGADPLFQLLSSVGFGRKTGISLSGESPGILPPKQRWGPVENATIAFGQGIAVTPLQLAAAFCVLANGGIYVYPKLVHGEKTPADQRVIPEEISKAVMHMLKYAASLQGTGALAVPDGYLVAGKTGTAQKPGRGGYSDDKFTAVFVGAVPADDPRLVIAVVIDEPRHEIYGGKVAAPIFRNIAANVLPYLGISPRLPQQPKWQALPAVAETVQANVPKGTVPSLFGKSLRDARRIAAQHQYMLRAHGSGWVIKQKPAAFSSLSAGTTVEVWLDG